MPVPDDLLTVLRAFVKAHPQPHPTTQRREPIFYFPGHGNLQHHALPDSPEVDDALLEEMRDEGLLDIDYRQNLWAVTPAPLGRAAIEQQDRIAARAALSTSALSGALIAQASSPSKLAWPVVRPVLAELRSLWEAGGFSPHGIPLPKIFDSLPIEQQELFAATVRSLIAGRYLDEMHGLVAYDLPVEVTLTERAHVILDGWPGAEPSELVENLLAVLTAAIATETDPERKTRLQRLFDTVKEIGVSTAGEVLAKVLTGGA